MWERMIKHKKNGFTLAEVLAVCIVFAIIVLAIIGAINRAYSFMGNIRLKVRATNFAREGIEMMYNIRDTNWRKCSGKKDANWLSLGTGGNSCDNNKSFSGGLYVLKEGVSSSGEWFIYAEKVVASPNLVSSDGSDIEPHDLSQFTHITNPNNPAEPPRPSSDQGVQVQLGDGPQGGYVQIQRNAPSDDEVYNGAIWDYDNVLSSAKIQFTGNYFYSTGNYNNDGVWEMKVATGDMETLLGGETDFYRLVRVYGIYCKSGNDPNQLVNGSNCKNPDDPKELRFCVKVFYKGNGEHTSELCSIMTNFEK